MSEVTGTGAGSRSGGRSGSCGGATPRWIAGARPSLADPRGSRRRARLRDLHRSDHRRRAHERGSRGQRPDDPERRLAPSVVLRARIVDTRRDHDETVVMQPRRSGRPGIDHRDARECRQICDADVEVAARSQVRVPISDVLATADPGVVVETFGGPVVVEHRVVGNDGQRSDTDGAGPAASCMALRCRHHRTRERAVARAVQPVR